MLVCLFARPTSNLVSFKRIRGTTPKPSHQGLLDSRILFRFPRSHSHPCISLIPPPFSILLTSFTFSRPKMETKFTYSIGFPLQGSNLGVIFGSKFARILLTEIGISQSSCFDVGSSNPTEQLKVHANANRDRGRNALTFACPKCN